MFSTMSMSLALFGWPGSRITQKLLNRFTLKTVELTAKTRGEASGTCGTTSTNWLLLHRGRQQGTGGCGGGHRCKQLTTTKVGKTKDRKYKGENEPSIRKQETDTLQNKSLKMMKNHKLKAVCGSRQDILRQNIFTFSRAPNVFGPIWVPAC